MPPPVRSVTIRDSRSLRCWCWAWAPALPRRFSPSSTPWSFGRCRYAAPDRLVTIWDTNAEKAAIHDPISPVNFMDVRALPVFEDAAAWWRPGINLVDPGLEPARVSTIEVSGNLFALLGVKPQAGAGFPESGPLFAPRELIAVISDRLWRTRYGADPSVIGRPLLLNDEPYTVVGVMPPGFHYPDDVDVWQRLRWDMTQHSRAAHFMEAVARMKPGVTVAQAQAAADALTGRFQTEFPQTNRGWGTRLVPQLDETLGYYRPALSVLLSAVAVLLAIACINVASLLLTRALSREREVAVRVALGATPRQLLLQMLAEGLILAAGGAVTGLALTAAALPLLQAYAPVSIPRLAEAAVDVRTVAAALAVIVGATMFFALVPALASLKRQLTTELKSGERGSSRGARRLYSVLVGAELALACGLLVGSALLVRTVQRMTETPTGVNAVDAATTRIQVRPAPGPQATVIARWSVLATQHAAILDAVRQEPGVQAAGATNFLPFEVGWREPFLIAGDPPPPRREDAPQAQLHSVSDGYFAAMGARIVRGRDFAAFDGPDAIGAVVVNETFARRYLADREPVGTTLTNLASGIGPLGVNLKWVRGQHGVPVRSSASSPTSATSRSARTSSPRSTSRRASSPSRRWSSRCAPWMPPPAQPPSAAPCARSHRQCRWASPAPGAAGWPNAPPTPACCAACSSPSAGWRRCWRRSAFTACSRGRWRCALASWRFGSRWGLPPARWAGWSCATGRCWSGLGWPAGSSPCSCSTACCRACSTACRLETSWPRPRRARC